ncbi:MAG TPA: hypothetical protein VMU05_15135 [Dongiaceae bacterium]|nr:hypothetical protein [Dongiaceae bacterium]
MSQQLSEDRSKGSNLLEFEQVDQIAEYAVIAAEGYSSVERGMNFLTIATAVTRRIETGRDIAGLSADPTQRCAERTKLMKTQTTNWNARNFNQRDAADAAIGGKKGKEEAGSSAFCPASDESTRCRGVGSPYSKPGTAEDGLPRPDRASSDQATQSKYSLARKAAQRQASVVTGMVPRLPAHTSFLSPPKYEIEHT